MPRQCARFWTTSFVRSFDRAAPNSLAGSADSPGAEVIRQHGESVRYAIASNCRVSAVNARRLGWSPKGPSLADVVEGKQ
jgi:hypothetical protein